MPCPKRGEPVYDMGLKALVLGNCQARPLTQILAQSAEIEVLEPIILHLAKEDERDAQVAHMAQADIIFAQQTADNFQRAWLRSDAVRAHYGSVAVWPNIFWAGQQPFLRYATHVTGGRLIGPLEALHDLRIYHDWLVGEGIIEDRSSGFDDAYASGISRASLAELQRREETCDVGISDFLTAHVDRERLFFTFNHPTARVLVEMARRLLVQSGLSGAGIDIPQREPLGHYVVPSHWSGTPPGKMQGDDFSLDPGGAVRRVPGPPKAYSTADLKAAFYAVYDWNPLFRDIANVRFTPRDPADGAFFVPVAAAV